MTPKSSGGYEFTQLVPNHILFDVDRHMPSTVMNGNGVADHMWKDR
jgi:hypothetical protein